MAERQAGPSGLSPTAAFIVTRVRTPPVRTTRATVLFADLRGYVGMAERLPAARVVPLLDEFLGALALSLIHI